MHTRTFAILSLALACAGCDDIFGSGPSELRQASLLAYFGEPVVVSVPDSADAGVSFPVQVRSYGNGCRTEGETPTVVQGLIAQVAPYELEQREGTCSGILQTFEHTTDITFATPGEAQVIILGVREPEHTRVTVTRTVVVRP
jgi:hypothetical protein